MQGGHELLTRVRKSRRKAAAVVVPGAYHTTLNHLEDDAPQRPQVRRVRQGEVVQHLGRHILCSAHERGGACRPACASHWRQKEGLRAGAGARGTGTGRRGEMRGGLAHCWRDACWGVAGVMTPVWGGGVGEAGACSSEMYGCPHHTNPHALPPSKPVGSFQAHLILSVCCPKNTPWQIRNLKV